MKTCEYGALKNPRLDCQMITYRKDGKAACRGTTMKDCTECNFYKPTKEVINMSKKVIPITMKLDKMQWQILQESLDKSASDYSVRARMSQRDSEAYEVNLYKYEFLDDLCNFIFDEVNLWEENQDK